jgi:hypothetical protein
MQGIGDPKVKQRCSIPGIELIAPRWRRCRFVRLTIVPGAAVRVRA